MRQAPPAAHVGWLVRDAGLVELCRLGNRGPERVEWFTDPRRLLARAQEWSRAGNLFTTLHRIDPDALAAHRQADPRKRTPDGAVARYCRVFFDFDPVRPRGTSSTDDELQEAEIRAKGLRDRMLAIGWPLPQVAMSGNGWHLQYRTALPNNDVTREELSAVYRGLATEFGDSVVSFDCTVRNPARLCALYGSLKRKGPHAAKRPHRQSVCWIPSEWRQVHPRQVEALANHYARQPSPTTRLNTPPPRQEAVLIRGAGDYRTLDVVRWFEARGAYVGHLDGLKHGVRCPWSHEHSAASPRNGSDTIIFESDGGWPGFHCKHAHCEGRTIRDVMALWGDADAFCSESFRQRRGAA